MTPICIPSGPRSYLPVRTKRDFARRYAAGEFGNASPTWTTPDAFLEWGRREFGCGPSYGRFHLRNGAEPGGATYFDQRWSQAITRWLEQRRPQDWFVSRQIPPKVEAALLLQGEVMREPGGLYLYATTVKKPMRVALRESSHSLRGLTALLALRWALCPNSAAWLEVLLDRYPDHVIEFSSYAVNWGTVPRHNTIFWEVRQY